MTVRQRRWKTLIALMIFVLSAGTAWPRAGGLRASPPGYPPKVKREGDRLAYLIGTPLAGVGGREVYIVAPLQEQSSPGRPVGPFGVRIDGEERGLSDRFLDDLALFKTVLGEELELLASTGGSLSAVEEALLASRYFSQDDLDTVTWMQANLDRDALREAIAAEDVVSALAADGSSLGDYDPAELDWECGLAVGGALLSTGTAFGCCGATFGVGCWLCAAGAAVVAGYAVTTCLSSDPPQPTPVICSIVCHDCGVNCECECIEAIGVDPQGYPICPPKEDCS